MADPNEEMRRNFLAEGVVDDRGFEALGTSATASAETAAAAQQRKGVPEIDKAKLEESYTFNVDVVIGRRRYVGKLTNIILSYKQQRQVGILRAQLGGGLPASALDDYTTELNLLTAHMQVSLARPWPEWLDFDNGKDERVLHALWKEVDSHEKTFRGSGQAT